MQFEWAKIFLKNINFGYCSQEEHDSHKKYKPRYEQAITIKNKRQFYHYEAINEESIKCKIFSEMKNYNK